MPEEIEKTEEALQTATFKTKAVVEQLTKGDVKGVWEKLWQSMQGEIWQNHPAGGGHFDHRLFHQQAHPQGVQQSR